MKSRQAGLPSSKLRVMLCGDLINLGREHSRNGHRSGRKMLPELILREEKALG